MEFLIGYGVTVLVISILVLVISAFVADRVEEIPEWVSFLGQASVFGIGASITGIGCLLVLDILIPISAGRDDFWGHLASGICISLVVAGFCLILVGGFGAVELLQRVAAAMRRKV